MPRSTCNRFYKDEKKNIRSVCVACKGYDSSICATECAFISEIARHKRFASLMLENLTIKYDPQVVKFRLNRIHVTRGWLKQK